jgi:serine/threonine protein phosphatase 1
MRKREKGYDMAAILPHLDKQNFIKRYSRNTAGRDFAVGDIHGCYPALQQILDEVEFDPSKDRLFPVGDLVDRGKNNEEVLEWLRKPWFHAVQGNHEEMGIMYAMGWMSARYKEAFLKHGGAWFAGRIKEEQMEYVVAYSELPYVIEVETSRDKVGIVHANAHYDWNTTIKGFENAQTQEDVDNLTGHILWDRLKFESEDPSLVKNIRAVVVGHNPTMFPVVLGNVYHIDTGAVYPWGRFTLLNLETLEFYPNRPEYVIEK